MRIVAVTIAALALAAAAAGAHGEARPTLAVSRWAPFTVHGTAFHAGERVTVEALAGRTTTRIAAADASGDVTARFAITLARCSAWLVRATGATGTTATLRPRRAACSVALSAGTAPPDGGTGVAGTVRRGPTTPVCRAETPCDAPAAGVGVDLLVAGVVVAHATTGTDGQFYVLAPPGDYVVRAAGRGLAPQPAHVRAGAFTDVSFLIDTGIR